MLLRKTTSLPLLAILAAGLLGLTACQDGTLVEEDGPQPEANEEMTTERAPQATPNTAQSKVYMADLSSLNDSGVKGKAKIFVRNGEFAVQVNAQGHVPRQVHAQHIHGFLDGTESSCPTLANDDDGDGFISVGEGGPAYGGILVPLDGSLDVFEENGLGDPNTFPNPDNEAGAITYRETVSTSDLAVTDDEERGFGDLTLENHAIVLHGDFVDGKYRLTAPVACGTLSLTGGSAR